MTERLPIPNYVRENGRPQDRLVEWGNDPGEGQGNAD
jgi:hypothetical protein